ncbi:hypothetical protein ZIOFF_029477 [Zingiber officinale]|uniref:Uncharacterized protein n=1 Tax=Zingiber officinale TaxID=94328 RepID=A0A8J5LAW8_ZINOF|nr:hypothetical protein ZIOFF_029477 [Zingiber officinale]
MIKRRFYRHEHVDRDGHSSSSSDSDSDSVSEVQSDREVEPHGETETEEVGVIEDSSDSDADEDDEDGEDSEDEMQQRRFPFSGSDFDKFPSERFSILLYDISAAVHPNIRSSEPIVGAEAKKYGTVNAGDISVDCNDPIQADLIFILKHKSVFKCRLCPKVICLSDETVKRHLSSKAHARFKKQFQVGTLKVMLNSDGEIEEEQETHAERYARIVALAKFIQLKSSGIKFTQEKVRVATTGQEEEEGYFSLPIRMLSRSNNENIEKEEKQEKKPQKTEGKKEKPKEQQDDKQHKTEGKSEKPNVMLKKKANKIEGKTENPKEKRGKKRLKTENKEKPKEEKHEKKRAKTEENTQMPKVEKQEQKRPKTEGTEKPKAKKKKKERKTKG